MPASIPPLLALGCRGLLLGAGLGLVGRGPLLVGAHEPVEPVDVLADALLALHLVHLLQHHCSHIKQLVSQGDMRAEGSNLMLSLTPAHAVDGPETVVEHPEQVLIGQVRLPGVVGLQVQGKPVKKKKK